VASRDSKVDRFIYASSSSTYGDNKTLPKVEDHVGKPLSPYAVTKQINELYADVFAKTYGLKIIGLKYFNVFGPRQNTKGAYAAVIPLFIHSILNQTPVFIDGDGSQSRDFTFVSNVIQANVKAALTTNESAFNQVFNIALGETTSVKFIFESVKNFANSSLEAEYRPSRPGDVKDSLANITKAVKLLQYAPEVSVAEGLRYTFDWFVKNQDFVREL
ncbi:MAG TPA: NAD-dependent epimerase/dehydratase family protein, partial [Cytophagaceae bacterium]